MKKKILVGAFMAVFAFSALFLFCAKKAIAHAPPTDYCYWNPIELECDTGGNCICIEVSPPPACDPL